MVVLDYGSGNVHSAAKALEAVGADVELSAEGSRAVAADGLVVPGVGAFAAVMAALKGVRGPEIIDRRLAGGRPVLGICVGMQVMFERGLERETDTVGLGQWPGDVARLDADILPHVGWNRVQADPGSLLFEGVRDERFYFVHSNAALDWALPEDDRRSAAHLTWAQHGSRFLAAVENGPLSATQFHPEKSGDAGLRVLANWVATLKVTSI